jgi:hypothetical protein
MSNLYVMKKGVSELADLVDGIAAGGMLAHLGGREFFLDPTHGNDGNDGRSPAKAVKTLPVGYGKLRDGYNDVLYKIPGSSSISLTTGLDWTKSYAHYIGLCAPVRVAQRARMFLSSLSVDVSPMLKFSGSGNIIANMMVFSGVDDAQALIDVQVTGARNYFDHVHFAGAGHATSAIDGAASLNLVGAEENEFHHCTIGLDTVPAAAGVAGLLLSGTPSTRNWFEDCLFSLWAGSADAAFVETVGVNMIDRYLWFKNCKFQNLSATALTVAMQIAAGTDPANKRIILEDCKSIGATDWSSIPGMVYLNNGAITGGTTAGQMVVNS